MFLSHEPRGISPALKTKIYKQKQNKPKQTRNKKIRLVHAPVRRMFMSMCLGVSPSLISTEDVAGMFTFFNTTEEVLLLVAGRDFLVML